MGSAVALVGTTACDLEQDSSPVVGCRIPSGRRLLRRVLASQRAISRSEKISSFEIRPLPGQLFGVERFQLQSQDRSRGRQRSGYVLRNYSGSVAKWSNAPDCKSGGSAFGGSNPPRPTEFRVWNWDCGVGSSAGGAFHFRLRTSKPKLDVMRE